MYIQIRTIDGQNTTITISKFTSVKELKELIEKELCITVDKQRLFFSGKQLENEQNVCDYNVNVNDVIQLMVKPDITVNNGVSNNNDSSKATEESGILSTYSKGNLSNESLYFKIGDLVDAKDFLYGAWFEGKIIGIERSTNDGEIHSNGGSIENDNDDGFIYKVLLNRYPFNNPLTLSLKEIRPRARNKIPPLSVKTGDMIMVNYSMDKATERGFWYDLLVTSVSINKTGKSPIIKGNINSGTGNNVVLLKDCKIKFIDDIMEINKNKLIVNRTEEELIKMQKETEKPRISAPFCEWCRDNAAKCTHCSCHKCGIKTNPEKQILCDECNMSYHIWCLTPPLDEVPSVDEWYCMECKNDENEIIKAGQKLKKSKIKKGKLSKIGNQGRGMACVGRAKDFTLVPFDHFGAIPGIEVGTTWKFRMQVAEAGVHRPHVAGIHGRENHGAYSIVVSGGYEDNQDDGDEIVYTGSGGRDLTGRRTAGQSCDQVLTRMNKALALNCNAPFNSVEGAESEDWRQGKPVRVVRNFRGARHSKYAPIEGNRYDGLYKVVKYYPEKGKSGFLVWRYLLRRDDPIPAPWTKEGKKRIKTLGLQIIYPDGYITAMEKKDKENSFTNKQRKRYRPIGLANGYSDTKRPKIIPHCLEEDISNEIDNDKDNAKLWTVLKSTLQLGKKAFLSKVEEEFTCICCHELIFQPITMKCKHNICKVCLKRSFDAEIYTCPYCRRTLGKNYKMIENVSLQKVLLELFPGYTSGR